MDGRPRFVRVFDAGIEKWLEGEPEVDYLAKLFNPRDAEQSVYEVYDGAEEWLAAAAHALTKLKGADATSILRLRVEDLGKFEITVDETQFGTTGVVWVDCRHRNLRGAIEQFRKLVQWVIGECRRGHDWLRRIDKASMRRTLLTLCNEPDCKCPPHVKNLAKKYCLKETSSGNVNLEQIEQELRKVEFSDEIIKPRAHCISSGDQPADWYASVNAMRRKYAQHYLPAIAKRLHLN